MVLLEAHVIYGYKTKLVDDFAFYIKKRPEAPKSEEEIKNLYNNFLNEKLFFTKNSPIDEAKVKSLESYVKTKELKPLYVIQNTEHARVKDKKLLDLLVKGFGKSSMSSGFFIHSLHNASLDTDERLTTQIKKDFERQFFDHLFVNDSHIRKPEIKPDDNPSWKDFIPEEIKEFLGNDEDKLRSVALLLTQTSSEEGNKLMQTEFAKTTSEANLNLIKAKGTPPIYKFEILNDERHLFIINDYEVAPIDKHGDKGRAVPYIATTDINLDKPNTPVYTTIF